MARLSVAAFGDGEDRAAETVERRAANLVRTAHPCSVIAETETGRLAGLAVTRQLGPLVLLAWAAVHPEFQGRGLLRAMLAEWPPARPTQRRLVLSSTDPRAMRAYAGLGLQLHPTVSLGGILRPGAVEPPAGVSIHPPMEVEAVLDVLGRAARGAGYPPGDLAVLEAQGDRVHLADLGAGRRAAVVAGGGIIRLAVAEDETAARLALRGALAAAPPGASIHLNQLRAGMDWAIQEGIAAGLVLSPDGPIYADGALSPLHLPNGSLG